MKRKLIRSNKQFLSSRYGKYLDGNGTFQRLTCHAVYFTKDDEMIFKSIRYKWQWFFNEDWMLAALSEIDQELELYK